MSTQVDVDGRTLALSNLDKVLYPAAGFTKGQVIDYYARIAPVMLPHLEGRPVTLKRYPNGVDDKFFYEKNCPKHRPDWMRTLPIEAKGWNSRAQKGTIIEYCLVDEPAALVWTANMAALELHPGLATEDDLQRPTCVVFDLDPGAPADVVDCAQVALWIRELFEQLGLQSVIKTSGSKGLQLYLPLNTPATFEDTAGFSQAVAQLLEKQHPNQVVSTQAKEKRKDKVLVDWYQNSDFKTTVAVYSLRARERPTVSTPITWDEVEKLHESRDAASVVFEVADVLERVEEHGDLFAPLVELEQALPKLG
ncbi:MAG: bifunctional non-ous end joining protein LigD [Actinomycetota bacterium]|nr:bifunctional non-ous end joining protein LigD [Actinomycetota bacterium]